MAKVESQRCVAFVLTRFPVVKRSERTENLRSGSETIRNSHDQVPGLENGVSSLIWEGESRERAHLGSLVDGLKRLAVLVLALSDVGRSVILPRSIDSLGVLLGLDERVEGGKSRSSSRTSRSRSGRRSAVDVLTSDEASRRSVSRDIGRRSDGGESEKLCIERSGKEGRREMGDGREGGRKKISRLFPFPSPTLHRNPRPLIRAADKDR